MSRLAYLDYNAGAPVRPEVVAAMAETLAEPGNPSSVHSAGRRARARMEDARAAVAALVGAQPAGVVFTSGGTEANNLVLRGCGRPRLLVSAVEHASVREAAPDAQVIPVDGDGVVDLAALERLLAAEAAPALVSVMLANNETGVIQPVAEVARIARAFGALVHCDAAQGPGRLSVSLSGLDVDFLTLSAHKLGGPAGIGALVSANADFPLAPILLGGGQERRRRAGSENLAGIVGFGTSIRLAADIGAEGDRVKELRDRLETAVTSRVPGAVVVGAGVARLCNTTCVALPGVPSQVQVMALDLAQVAVSAGSACSSGKVGESAVLRAMGLEPAVSGSAIRVSLGWGSTAEDVEMFLSAWCELARRKGFEVRDAAQAA
ncbi:MAG: cysteine desulfurase family protein [Bacteroidales bacterium]